MHEHSTRRDTSTAKPASTKRAERAHHPSAAGNDWSCSGATTTRGGTSLGGSLTDDHGQFSGSANGVGPGGDSASVAGYGGSKGYGGMGAYDGQYGDLNLGF